MTPFTPLALLAALALCGSPAGAQAPTADSTGRVLVVVTHGPSPLRAVLVTAGDASARTDTLGRATLRLRAGVHAVVASRIGFHPAEASVNVHAGGEHTLTITMHALAELEAVIVSATRSERRVEDVPLRVEVIDEEEIAEKVAMTPGDIAMMLNETSGLRVQVTSPSLGGAQVRIQGLAGRHSLLLADGLPLYGGQAGGLGLLQVPPVDLGRVEIIKGTASALYGSAALGGVVNLLSRRPGEEAEQTVLANQTSRDGTDGVAFLSAPIGLGWSYTLLAGAHRQSRRDLDGDGWTDLPGYERVVVRPRFHLQDDARRTAFVTAGYTAENRRGGTLDGRVAPDGRAYPEALTTRRADVGGLLRHVLLDDGGTATRAVVSLRGSAMEQRHAHTFGRVQEDDRHGTWFGEATVAMPRQRATVVAGAALQQDRYVAEDVAGFDYAFTVPAVFAQLDVDAAAWVALSASARADAHSHYGATLSPRVSLLLRRPAMDAALAGWTTRLSAGAGSFAPTPFTDETEATGLTPLLPLRDVRQERAESGSIDVGGPVELPLGRVELNATAFASRVHHPLQVRDASGATADGASRIQLVNGAAPTRTWGGELLARLVREIAAQEPTALRVTGTYTYVRSTECETSPCTRRDVPLTPRHAAGIVAAVEQHERGRVGLEVYYTGRQSLDDNPYRAESRPYVILGLLGERAFETRAGTARVFLNLENLTDVRQTRHDPLLLPSRGRGGRWTTDAWTDLVGFTANGGVRLTF